MAVTAASTSSSDTLPEGKAALTMAMMTAGTSPIQFDTAYTAYDRMLRHTWESS